MTIRKIVRLLMLALFVLFQIYLLFFKEFQVLDYSPYLNEIPFPLGGEKCLVGQEFRTPGPLGRIDIMLANYLSKPQQGTLRLTIFKGNQRLFFKNFPANQAEDNRFYSFTMRREKTPPIPRGQYHLQLDYFAKDPMEKLAVWVSNKNLYPHGGLLINHHPQAGDMTFRVYYLSTLWNAKAKWLDNVPIQPYQRHLMAFSLLLLLLIINSLFFYLSGLLCAASGLKEAAKS